MEHAGPSEAAGRGSLHVVDQVSLATAHSGERAARALPAGEWRPERLPKQPGTLIGREWEQQAIRHSLLQQDVRLLTVLGPAGVGKTCLALAVASQLEVQAAFAD
ncbi:MAG TPA: hypothetical protein VK898_08285, partial [Chloroflexota bacterium]|nr:hypothetical protein [Chloroflexota bacterium]